MNKIIKDVVIVGAGGAGLVAAIHAHESGADVVVLTKEYATRSQTSMAQGGINATLGNAGEDSVEAHVKNTLKSAHGLANKEMVEFLCQEAPKSVAWLDSIGVPFSRTKENKIAQRTLGGASASRACYAQDYTGLKILHTLYDRCLALGITILNEKYLLEVLSSGNDEKSVRGVSVLDKRSSKIEVYEAKSVILATGGFSKIYHNNSTNSSASTGDGIVCAMRAGAKVSDMEFIQFHPTALKSSAILISESARGAGGYLLNSKGERFTDELKPRDEVARAIYDEMAKGEDIFLDVRHLGESFIDEELPQERKLAIFYEGVDPVSEIIPIKPVAHYTMGGIEVDRDSQTNIEGLFAVGECANHKVHGANRLGGNSLLELVVFGKEAGLNASKNLKNQTQKELHIEFNNNYLDSLKKSICEVNFYEKHKILGDMFYKYAGIKRDEAGLNLLLNTLLEIRQELPLMGVEDDSKVYNTNLIEFLEFRNMLELCEAVLVGALQRKKSIGAHFRSDG